MTSALEMNNYFRWLINYQIHITNGSSKVPSKLFNLFISYLKHGQRDASPRDLLCTLLILKLGHPIHIHLIMKDCCTLIESYSYSVSRANNRPLDAQYLHLRSWELLAAALGPIKTSSSTESNYSQSQYDMSNYTHTSSSSSSSSSSQNLFGINLHPKRQNQRCNLPDDFIRKKSDWSKSLLSQLNLGDFVEYIGQPEAWIIINSDFMTQLLEVRLRSIKPEAWFDRQQMQRAADIYDASSYNTFEEEDEDEGEDAPKQQSQIKKRKTDGNNSDSDDSGTDFEGDIASLPNISHSTKKHPITASSPYKTDKTNKGANLEEMFAQVLSENEAGDRLINQFLHHGSEALFSITNNDTDVDDVDDGEQSQSLFRSQYRNYPVEECGLWLKRAGVGVSNKKKKAFKFQPEVLYPFVELGDRQLDVLTCQIIVSAHLTGADSLFVCRGVQILLQHAILHSLDSFARAHVRKDIKVAIRHQLNDTKQTYAHICLATLTQLNIDIEKTAQFASEYASNTKKGVATQQRQKRER